MNNLLLRYEKHHKAFWVSRRKRIDLEIFEGEICALVGEKWRGQIHFGENHCRRSCLRLRFAEFRPAQLSFIIRMRLSSRDRDCVTRV
jgi:hypothetical protein